MNARSNGAGLRHRRSGFFVQVPRDTIRDRRISYGARGLLAYILDLPEGWVVKTENLADVSDRDGRAKVSTLIHELCKYGYYRMERRRLTDGTFKMGQSVSETPVPEWAEQYAEYGDGPVTLVQRRDGEFQVIRKDGRVQSDGFEGQLDPLLEAPDAENLLPVDLRVVDPRPEADFRDPVEPNPAEPNPAEPDSENLSPKKKEARKGDARKETPMVNGSAVDQVGTLARGPSLDIDALFADFWEVWPRHVKKADARLTFEQILLGTHKPRGKGLHKPYPVAEAAAVIGGARRFAADCIGTPADKIPHPTTWLNDRRWEDEAYADTQARVGAPKQDRGGRPNGFYGSDDLTKDSSDWFDPQGAASDPWAVAQ